MPFLSEGPSDGFPSAQTRVPDLTVQPPDQNADNHRHGQTVDGRGSSLRRLFQYSPALPERLQYGTVARVIQGFSQLVVPTAFRNSAILFHLCTADVEYVASSTSNDGVSQPTSSDVNFGDTRPAAWEGRGLRTIELKDDEVF